MTSDATAGAGSTADLQKCTYCHHEIDAAARLCPYCGADPRTGERFDPAPLLESHFPKRAELAPHESVLEYLRQRQAIVLGLLIAALLIGGTALHRYVTERNASEVSDVPAIPLTEVADLSNRETTQKVVPIPEMDFQYSGNPQTVRLFVLEPGAVAPAPPQPAGGAPAPQMRSGAAAVPQQPQIRQQTGRSLPQQQPVRRAAPPPQRQR